MRYSTTIGTALIAALALLAPTTAQTCDARSDALLETPATHASYTGVGDGAYYVANDPCMETCFFSVWIYEETNGLEGLQRGDEIRDDTCGGAIEPDSIVL